MLQMEKLLHKFGILGVLFATAKVSGANDVEDVGNNTWNFWTQFRDFLISFDTPFKIVFTVWLAVMLLILISVIIWRCVKTFRKKKETKIVAETISRESVVSEERQRLQHVSNRTDRLSGTLNRNQMKNMYQMFPSNGSLVQAIMKDKQYWDERKQNLYNSL